MSTGSASPSQESKKFTYAPASPLTPVKHPLSKTQSTGRLPQAPVVPLLSISSTVPPFTMADTVADVATLDKALGDACESPGRDSSADGISLPMEKGGVKALAKEFGDLDGDDSPAPWPGAAGSLAAAAKKRNGMDDAQPAPVSRGRAALAKKTVVVTAEELVSNVKESLVAQRRRTLERKGEQLTVMCIGEAGSGKTTLAQSLFVQPIPKRSIGTKSTVDIEESVMDMVMGQGDATVKVHLRMVDSPGYGDNIDVESSFKRVTDYIEAGFDRVLELEKRVDRPDYGALNAAVGVDAILYFIAPHRLKRLDIEFLKRIHKRASVLPIISKADTMTTQELAAFRAEVIQRLADEKIETFADPFAVICCAVSSEPDSKGMISFSRGREYPWGTALADDPDHSDLPLLRQTLLTDGLLELHQARTEKFEVYRREQVVRLQNHGFMGGLRKVRRWAVGFTLNALIAFAFVKGMQAQIENKAKPVEKNEEVAATSLVEDCVRERRSRRKN